MLNYHSVKDKGKPVNYKDVLKWTSQNSELPVFILQNDVGHEKADGALLLDGVAHGRLAGSIANQILDGQPTKRYYEDSSYLSIFSRAALDKYQIKLPDDMKKNATIVD